MTTLQIKKTDFKLFGLWLLAAVAGRMLFQGLQGFIGQPVESIMVSGAIFALLSGVIRAVAQSGVLLNRIENVKQWALLTFAGVTLNGVLIVYAQDWIIQTARLLNPEQIWSFYVYFALVQGLQGVIIGFFQWLVLRLEAERAGWWVLFVALGNALGVLALVSINQNYPNQNIDFAPFVSVLVNGLITASGIVWLMRNPREWADDEEEITEEE